MNTPQDYIMKIMEARWAGLQVIADKERRLIEVLESAKNDIIAKLQDMSTDNKITREMYLQKKAILQQKIEEITNLLSRLITSGTIDVAERYSKSYREAMSGIIVKAKNVKDISVAFTNVATIIVERTLMRYRADGLKLSERLYRLNQNTKKLLENTILSGIATGESTEEIAKKVRTHFKDASIFTEEELADMRKVKGSKRGFSRSLNYNAKRLLRTEINNAFHEAQVYMSENDPTVIGNQWKLSNRHTIFDECDYAAKANLYGLGRGIYPTNRTPVRPHPNCICHIIPVLREPEQWHKQKPEFKIDMGFTDKYRSEKISSPKNRFRKWIMKGS